MDRRRVESKLYSSWLREDWSCAHSNFDGAVGWKDEMPVMRAVWNGPIAKNDDMYVKNMPEHTFGDKPMKN